MTGQVTALDGEAVGTPATSSVDIETCDTPDGLSAVQRPGTQLVIWQRALPSRLHSWLDRIDASCLPDTRILVRPGDLRAALQPHLDDCGLPQGDLRDLFVQDVGDLVSTFSKVTRSDLVDVRLERVSHDACWKFHRDCVEARLLTTYRGPATEWVQPIHGERALREQKRFRGPIERLGIHDVAIFKGSCAGPGSGIVHRSPAVAGTGRTRLLLCLNKRSTVSPDVWPARGC